MSYSGSKSTKFTSLKTSPLKAVEVDLDATESESSVTYELDAKMKKVEAAKKSPNNLKYKPKRKSKKAATYHSSTIQEASA